MLHLRLRVGLANLLSDVCRGISSSELNTVRTRAADDDIRFYVSATPKVWITPARTSSP